MNGAASGGGVEQIRDAVDDLGALLGRVDMHSERALAGRHVHDPRKRFGHFTGVCIRADRVGAARSG
jgi:hypothetical protein